MSTLSIIVPVYQNELSLPPLFERLKILERELTSLDMTVELIFVDDGSRDNSVKELLKIKEQRAATKIVRLTRNFGAVRASKMGAQFATGDCLVILAADLQDPPELITQMVQQWRRGSPFVICVRRTREDPLTSILFSKIYYFLVRLMISSDFPAAGYDMALIDRVMIPFLQKSGKTMYTPISMFLLGFQPDIIYYDRAKRIHGRSKWTFRKRLVAAVDVLFGYSVAPIRLVSLLGVLVSLASCSYALSVIIHALLGQRQVMGFATIVALICFLLGIIIVTLGVIGEYLWRIFEETNKRPEAVVKDIQ